MRKSYCLTSLLLCIVLVSCTRVSPRALTPTNALTKSPISTIHDAITQTIAPTKSPILISPTALAPTIAPTNSPVSTTPTATQSPLVSTISITPDAIPLLNLTNQLQQFSQGHENFVSDLAFSPNGNILVSTTENDNESNQSSAIHLWDLKSGLEKTHLSGFLAEIRAIAFSPDGTLLASGGFDGVHLWDMSTLESTLIMEGHPDTSGEIDNGNKHEMYPVTSMAFSPDGATLAVASGGWYIGPGWLELYDAGSGIKLNEYKPAGSRIDDEIATPFDIAYSPDGTLLASADGIIRLWDAANGQVLQVLSEDRHFLTRVAFSPDGKVLAIADSWYAGEGADSRGGVVFLDVESGEKLNYLDVGSGIVWSIAFSPDGKLLAFGLNQNVILWDITARMPLARIECEGYPVIGFSPDGTILAVGDISGLISLWNVPATPIPGAVPEGWQIYRSGNISIGIAPEWKEYSPGFESSGVWFSLPNSATLFIAVEGVRVCGLGSGSEAKDIQDCLAGSSQGWIYPDDVSIVTTGEWWDGVHKGDYVEVINRTHMYYLIRIIALISPEDNQTLEAFYHREGLMSPTDAEREQLRNAIATLQLNPKE